MTANGRQPSTLTSFDRSDFDAMVKHGYGLCLHCRSMIPDVWEWTRGKPCCYCARPGVWGAQAARHDLLFDFE